MKSVLFVCLGNICRSPMGEGILRYKANAKGLQIEIDSAGIGNWHAGESPDRRAAKTSKAHGIDISGQKARQIVIEDFNKFDLILVADAEVYKGVLSLAPKEKDKLKVEFIMNLVHPNSNQAVPDPYYGGADGFENVFDMLDKACDSVIANLEMK